MGGQQFHEALYLLLGDDTVLQLVQANVYEIAILLANETSICILLFLINWTFESYYTKVSPTEITDYQPSRYHFPC